MRRLRARTLPEAVWTVAAGADGRLAPAACGRAEAN
jgi:hypothetical protein